ncbi:hypothetical protein CBL_04288 [Carabus blaptoides fortunei]
MVRYPAMLNVNFTTPRVHRQKQLKHSEQEDFREGMGCGVYLQASCTTTPCTIKLAFVTKKVRSSVRPLPILIKRHVKVAEGSTHLHAELLMVQGPAHCECKRTVATLDKVRYGTTRTYGQISADGGIVCILVPRRENDCSKVSVIYQRV